MKPAIIIIAYNRPAALQRLLGSLVTAHFSFSDITLVISIDKGNNKEVTSIANDFEWAYGPKEVIIQPAKLGTRKHVLFCGELISKYGSAIILEDDLGVSPWFYHYGSQALAFYENDEQIAGISLYGYQVAESNFRRFNPAPSAYDSYLMQFPSSWGQAWTASQWKAFRQWLEEDKQPVQIPAFVKAWSGASWKKDYLSYMLATDKYFVYPYTSLSTNYGDRGVNFSLDLQLYRVPLEQQKKEYRFGKIDQEITIMNAYFLPKGKLPVNEQPVFIENAEYQLLKEKGNRESYWKFKLRYTLYNYLNVLKKRLLPVIAVMICQAIRVF